MRTYYIKFERQGWTLAIIKVEAETQEEAENKALRALHINDEIFEVTEGEAQQALDTNDVDYILDENGAEVEMEYSEAYKLHLQDNSGVESDYIYYDKDKALADAEKFFAEGDGGYLRVSVHEVENEDDEVTSENCIWLKEV